MEGFKEFLETSTIHGLNYISTIKNRIIKLFWIIVVIGGFVIASILINSSFSEWEKSPISTTTETFPISECFFPKLTVCPPKGTSTPLNYGLVKSDHVSLNIDARNELIELAEDFCIEGLFYDKYSIENHYKENEKSKK